MNVQTLLVDRLRSAWSAHRRYRTALGRKRLQDLGGVLDEEKRALQGFTAAMEEEFLVLGGLLKTVTSLARQVRTRSDEIISAVPGRSEDAAIQFAFQLLKKAE